MMQGWYIEGRGKAHQCCRPHTEVFNCSMIGTFNVRVPHLRIESMPVSIKNKDGSKRYWFVKLHHVETNQTRFGWAIRDVGSSQCQNTLEVLTKQRLPDAFKHGVLHVEVPKRWPINEQKEWAKNKYWFQTFSFSPVKRADSAIIWKTIDCVEYTGKTVLDVGCHYGYFSFEASKKGAIVTGVDKNVRSLNMARTIRDHIVQQDVTFKHCKGFPDYPKNSYDIIFYLSVHHQLDENYERLAETLAGLKRAARQWLFVELIQPPTFPKNKSLTDVELDRLVGGKKLLTYKHAVRGVRTIYQLKGES